MPPWQWKAEENIEVEPPKAKEREEAAAEAPTNQAGPNQRKPQRVWIQRPDVINYGATKGCDGCRAAIDGVRGRKHTESCRARWVKEFEKTPEGRAKLKLAQKRFEERGDEDEPEPNPKSRRTETIPEAHSAERDPEEEETSDSSSSSSSSDSDDEDMEEAPVLQEPPAMEDRDAKRQRLAAVTRSEVGGMGGGR